MTFVYVVGAKSKEEFILVRIIDAKKNKESNNLGFLLAVCQSFISTRERTNV